MDNKVSQNCPIFPPTSPRGVTSQKINNDKDVMIETSNMTTGNQKVIQNFTCKIMLTGIN
jgi:hypothetical protein